MRASPPLLDFANNASRYVITRQQFRRTPRVLIALAIAPAFLCIVRSLGSIILRNFVEHKSSAGIVCQDPAFAANTLRHEHSGNTRRPDHSGRMKLHELHVD